MPGQDSCASHRQPQRSSRGGGLGAYGNIDGDLPVVQQQKQVADCVEATSSSLRHGRAQRRHIAEGHRPAECSAPPAQMRRLNEQGDSMPGSQQTVASESHSREDDSSAGSQQTGVPGSQDSVLADRAATALAFMDMEAIPAAASPPSQSHSQSQPHQPAPIHQ